MASGAFVGIGVLGAIDLARSVRRKSTLTDVIARVVIDRLPIPVVEFGVWLLRTKDKPVLRLQILLGATLITAPFRVRVRHDRLLTATGLMAWVAARVVTNRRHRISADRYFSPIVSDGADRWQGVRPLWTPVSDFYRTDISPAIPTQIDESIVVSAGGEVVRRLSTLDWINDHEVLDMTLVCIHQRPGWDRLGTQRFGGRRLSRVLSDLDLDGSRFAWITFSSSDGFSQTIPTARLRKSAGEPWIITRMANGPLPDIHGGPIRVLTPGLHGQYGALKWLSRIELHDNQPNDYWISRGWPAEAPAVPPSSHIDHPAHKAKLRAGTIEISGVAWHPPHGVARVVVSIDGHEHDAELAEQLSPNIWRRWRLQTSIGADSHRITARSVSETGEQQHSSNQPPFPGPAQGLHSIEVNARK